MCARVRAWPRTQRLEPGAPAPGAGGAPRLPAGLPPAGAPAARHVVALHRAHAVELGGHAAGGAARRGGPGSRARRPRGPQARAGGSHPCSLRLAAPAHCARYALLRLRTVRVCVCARQFPCTATSLLRRLSAPPRCDRCSAASAAWSGEPCLFGTACVHACMQECRPAVQPVNHQLDEALPVFAHDPGLGRISHMWQVRRSRPPGRAPSRRHEHWRVGRTWGRWGVPCVADGGSGQQECCCLRRSHNASCLVLRGARAEEREAHGRRPGPPQHRRRPPKGASSRLPHASPPHARGGAFAHSVPCGASALRRRPFCARARAQIGNLEVNTVWPTFPLTLSHFTALTELRVRVPHMVRQTTSRSRRASQRSARARLIAARPQGALLAPRRARGVTASVGVRERVR